VAGVTAILPLTRALVAPSPAFSGSPVAGSAAAADRQALNSLTYQFTGSELQALFCKVKDLLEAGNSPSMSTPASCTPLFPTRQLVYQSSVTSRVRDS
jgi:hypothetical protein